MVTIRFSLTTVLALAFCTSFAQRTSTGQITWKKQVARTIDISAKEDTVIHMVNSGVTLLEMIADARRTGKISLYSNRDHEFTCKLTDPEIKVMFAGKTDTTVLPALSTTGHETTRVVTADFNYQSVHKYRILEDWTFNPNTGKTEIQIAGVAPIREVFGPDGSFRGVQAMFWIRYSDLRPLLIRHQRLHPGTSLAGYIWNDYFSGDIREDEKRDDWETRATRVIGLVDGEDTIVHYLRNYSDSSFFDLVMWPTDSAKVPSYSNIDHGFINKLTKKDINTLWRPRVDLQVITDPVTREEVTKMLQTYLHALDDQKYLISEKWSFNVNTGKTNIDIEGLAPLEPINGSNNLPLKPDPVFWVRYEDVRNAISKYDQYHPENSFALHIWNSYFLSETKPMVQK